MDGDDTETQAPAKADARLSWRERLGDVQKLVPILAVATVVATALLATVMVMRDRESDRRESAVVLTPRANALGAGPACANCGVVESVAAGDQLGQYHIRVRMDDGSVRTLQHRGVLSAGSRVVLEDGVLRVMPAAARQG